MYAKAAVLLRELVCAHAFASGNRRTAFITVMNFVLQNKQTFNISDTPSNARVLTGIREKYYSDEEIRDWIQHGKIREFTR
ncbi:MAG: Fic family protein [Candidatus Woesearchaeota archaeon]